MSEKQLSVTASHPEQALAWPLQRSHRGATGMQLEAAEAAKVEAQAAGLQFVAVPTAAGLIRSLRSPC